MDHGYDLQPPIQSSSSGVSTSSISQSNKVYEESLIWLVGCGKKGHKHMYSSCFILATDHLTMQWTPNHFQIFSQEKAMILCAIFENSDNQW